MVGISSTASAFLKKLRGKSNPYEKAYRDQCNGTAANKAINQPPIDAPEGDLLAEARAAAGRNPVTGRRVTGIANQRFTQRLPELEDPSQTTPDPKAAYLAWAAQNPEERGRPYSSYEEFVQEMIAKRDGRSGVAGGSSTYYAPERRVEEFYAERLRD